MQICLNYFVEYGKKKIIAKKYYLTALYFFDIDTVITKEICLASYTNS